MDRADVFKIIAVLKAVYNTTYGKYTKEDFDNLANGWLMCLEDYDYKTVSVAVKAYMTTNTSKSPPVPSELIDIIQNFNQQQNLNANEAWALVYKAICNSSTHAQYEYDKLPPAIQKAVGSPDSLRALAIDPDFNYGVEQSHFAKVYNIELQREREIAKLPNSVKNAIGIATTVRKEIAVNE